jgi:hypothetical protein
MKTNVFRAWRLIAGLTLMAGQTFASGVSLVNSYWSPADFSDDFGPGLKLQASLSEIYALEFRTSLFPDMGEDVIVEEERVQVDLSVMPLEFGFIANVPYIYDPLVQSYVGGGFGYYLIDLSAKGPAGSIDYNVSDEIGFFLVAGGRLHFTPELVMIAELQYRIVEGEAKSKTEDGTTSEIDMKLNGFGASLGLGVMW